MRFQEKILKKKELGFKKGTLVNTIIQKVTTRQIEIKYKIWSGLEEVVFNYPQAGRKFFSNLSFGKTEDLSFLIFTGI